MRPCRHFSRYLLLVLALAIHPVERIDAAASLRQVEIGGVLQTPPAVLTGEGFATPPVGGLIAYSLKAAQLRLLASANGDDWRKHDPELFVLAGITRLDGALVDRANGDIILIGHAKDGDAPLTLDDFVVALRARAITGKWPVVSIDPAPGKPAKESDRQTVRFEGNIQNTQFGADLLDADHRLKRMAFGFLPTGIPGGLPSAFDRELASRAPGQKGPATAISARMWFEPVQDRVFVRDDVVQPGPMAVSIYTEVLSISVAGKTLDPNSYHDPGTDQFAKELSAKFDDLARAHPTIARVRGLNQIVAIVAGLEQVDDKPSLDYWLHQYAVRVVETPQTVSVLRRHEEIWNDRPMPNNGVQFGSKGYGLTVSGGVQLQAIALPVPKGDVTALRNAVLAARPDAATVSWRLIKIDEWVIPLSPGVLPLPAFGSLFSQATFLENQRRWDDAIAILDAALQMLPQSKEADGYRSAALFARGTASESKGQYDRAIEDLTQALTINPTAAAYSNRGSAYAHKAEYDRAILDFDEALRLDGDLFFAFANRGAVYLEKGQYDEAIKDYNRAIQLNPNNAPTYYGRGRAFRAEGHQDRAALDFAKARQLDPEFTP